jgi:hypothetical protein
MLGVVSHCKLKLVDVVMDCEGANELMNSVPESESLNLCVWILNRNQASVLKTNDLLPYTSSSN